MAIFGIELERNKESIEFIMQTNHRLKDSNLVKNPFMGNVCFFDNTAIVNMRPVIPNFTPFCMMGLVGTIAIFQKINWLVIAFAVLSSFYFFWSTFFFRMMFKKGLFKSGYIGKFSALDKNEAFQRVLNVANRSL